MIPLLDLSAMLPLDAADQTTDALARLGRDAVLTGDAPDSLEARYDARPPSRVRSLTAPEVAESLPWLMDLYLGVVADLAYCWAEAVPMPGPAGLTVNALTPGAHYEWHTDLNALTCVLFLEDHASEYGGGLRLRLHSGDFVVRPERGRLVMLRGATPHSVDQVLGLKPRLSVPMAYTASGDPVRPPGLDAYLYPATPEDPR